jgi:hypothetical protein
MRDNNRRAAPRENANAAAARDFRGAVVYNLANK